jgi:outer membrane lipoprotein-sorting protein
MKQKLLILILLLLTFFVSVVFVRETKNKKPQVSVGKIQLETPKAPSNENFLIDLLKEVNELNKNIFSFSCEEAEVKIWENGHRFRLQAKVFYQKPLSFHMKVNSIFGEELVLGSNDKSFWYWSRRDRRPALYWASYEDFSKTRLKTPFNPMFMKSTLGLEDISLSDAKISETQKKILVTYPRVDSMGRAILYSVLVDKQKKIISGFLIANTSGQNLVECMIERANDNSTTKINYIWHEENRVMTLEFKNAKYNQDISRSVFLMPNIDPKINMADE